MSAEEMVALSKKYTFFEWSAQSAANPIPVARAKGVYFWDADGKRYLDFNSQLMCVNIGHGDARVINAIKEQAERLAYANPFLTSEPRARLGQMLAEIAPGDINKFFFTLGGAEANENAIKLARAYTGRHKIIARYRSYHGATHGAVTLTGDPRRWAAEPGLPGIVRVFDPYRYRCTFCKNEDACTMECLNHIEEVITYEGAQNIAAVFIETVTGTNGLIVPPEGYLAGLRALCDKYKILLVCDEVMSGFGRTGEWFAVDHWEVVPDIITMAKGLTSAYTPLGAVGMRDEIAAAFENKVFYGGLTYNSHPLCLAAAVAAINVIKEDNLIENARHMGAVMADLLADLKAEHRSVGDVRSIGLFGMVELVRSRKTREPLAPYNGTSPEMQKLGAYFREHGLYTFVRWNNFFTNPPLIVTEGQLREGFEIINEALSITDEAAMQ
jgi:taurine--2-oxoglutarate transaminase